MKKLRIILSILLCFTLVGCGSCSKKGTSLESFVEKIYDSNESFTSYQETDSLLDGDVEVYHKDISFQIERGTDIKTTYEKQEKKLSNDILSSTGYDITESSYYTIGNRKHDTSNGLDVESSYPVPTYFFTFDIKREYLQDEFSIKKDGKKRILTASVKDESVNDFFLTLGIESVQNLQVVVTLTSNKLTSMEANYHTTTGFDGSIKITYDYSKVTINH